MPKDAISLIPRMVKVVWTDAVSEEAASPDTPINTGLITLIEVGFLLGESETAITIGMELEGYDDGGFQPSRFRLHIPKALIQELSTVDVQPTRKRRSRL